MAERAKTGFLKGAGVIALVCGCCLLVVSTGLLEALLASGAPVMSVSLGGGFWKAVHVVGGASAALGVMALGLSLVLAPPEQRWSWRRILPICAIVGGIIVLASGGAVAAILSHQVASSAPGIASDEVVEAVERSIWARGAARAAFGAAVALAGVALGTRRWLGRGGAIALATLAVVAWIGAALAQAASLGIDALTRKLMWGVYWVNLPREAAYAAEAGIVVAAGAAICAGVVAAAISERRGERRSGS